jgi:hypothetical protein
MRTKAIKKWLIQKDYNQAMIARGLGCSRQFVSQTITGMRASARVIRWLLDHGCPESYLDKPRPAGRPMKKAA